MADYILKPCDNFGSFEDLSIARQRLVWWLDTHGMVSGTISQGGKKVGTISKIDGDWIWSPKGTRTSYKINTANGALSTPVKK